MYIIFKTVRGGEAEPVMRFNTRTDNLPREWLRERSEWYGQPEALSHDGVSFLLKDGTHYHIQRVDEATPPAA